ncbi:hypothetical protein ADUPG1_013251 [Aduncisulcus paluster]|uniref:Uncharacterized protein n=1 Tax=Aduncisulcus paluster TaxID=2918883 RepID=A0ABQ5K5I6_9EUKA|nr:hypothetical protein ADUPG1_013251 [Aduncisulcus paluster]
MKLSPSNSLNRTICKPSMPPSSLSSSSNRPKSPTKARGLVAPKSPILQPRPSSSRMSRPMSASSISEESSISLSSMGIDKHRFIEKSIPDFRSESARDIAKRRSVVVMSPTFKPSSSLGSIGPCNDSSKRKLIESEDESSDEIIVSEPKPRSPRILAASLPEMVSEKVITNPCATSPLSPDRNRRFKKRKYNVATSSVETQTVMAEPIHLHEHHHHHIPITPGSSRPQSATPKSKSSSLLSPQMPSMDSPVTTALCLSTLHQWDKKSETSPRTLTVTTSSSRSVRPASSLGLASTHIRDKSSNRHSISSLSSHAPTSTKISVGTATTSSTSTDSKHGFDEPRSHKPVHPGMDKKMDSFPRPSLGPSQTHHSVYLGAERERDLREWEEKESDGGFITEYAITGGDNKRMMQPRRSLKELSSPVQGPGVRVFTPRPNTPKHLSVAVMERVGDLPSFSPLPQDSKHGFDEPRSHKPVHPGMDKKMDSFPRPSLGPSQTHHSVYLGAERERDLREWEEKESDGVFITEYAITGGDNKRMMQPRRSLKELSSPVQGPGVRVFTPRPNTPKHLSVAVMERVGDLPSFSPLPQDPRTIMKLNERRELEKKKEQLKKQRELEEKLWREEMDKERKAKEAKARMDAAVEHAIPEVLYQTTPAADFAVDPKTGKPIIVRTLEEEEEEKRQQALKAEKEKKEAEARAKAEERERMKKSLPKYPHSDVANMPSPSVNMGMRALPSGKAMTSFRSSLSNLAMSPGAFLLSGLLPAQLKDEVGRVERGKWRLTRLEREQERKRAAEELAARRAERDRILDEEKKAREEWMKVQEAKMMEEEGRISEISSDLTAKEIHQGLPTTPTVGLSMKSSSSTSAAISTTANRHQQHPTDVVQDSSQIIDETADALTGSSEVMHPPPPSTPQVVNYHQIHQGLPTTPTVGLSMKSSSSTSAAISTTANRHQQHPTDVVQDSSQIIDETADALTGSSEVMHPPPPSTPQVVNYHRHKVHESLHEENSERKMVSGISEDRELLSKSREESVLESNARLKAQREEEKQRMIQEKARKEREAAEKRYSSSFVIAKPMYPQDVSKSESSDEGSEEEGERSPYKSMLSSMMHSITFKDRSKLDDDVDGESGTKKNAGITNGMEAMAPTGRPMSRLEDVPSVRRVKQRIEAGRRKDADIIRSYKSSSPVRSMASPSYSAIPSSIIPNDVTESNNFDIDSSKALIHSTYRQRCASRQSGIGRTISLTHPDKSKDADPLDRYLLSTSSSSSSAGSGSDSETAGRMKVDPSQIPHDASAIPVQPLSTDLPDSWWDMYEMKKKREDERKREDEEEDEKRIQDNIALEKRLKQDIDKRKERERIELEELKPSTIQKGGIRKEE